MKTCEDAKREAIRNLIEAAREAGALCRQQDAIEGSDGEIDWLATAERLEAAILAAEGKE